jgi:hypothetical protein
MNAHRSPAGQGRSGEAPSGLAGRLISIVYVSHLANEASLALDAESIAEYSRIGGRKTKITGLMVVQGGWTFQALEGERRAILALFDNIQRDSRHTDVTLLHVEDIAQRSFSTWSKVSVRRKEQPTETAARLAAVVERLTNLGGVSALDIFRALFVPSLNGPPLSRSDARIWRLSFLSPSGLWSANVIQYFARQMQQRVGRTWFSAAVADDPGSLVEYVDFDDRGSGHVRGISFFNDAVLNPALAGIMENVAVVGLLLNSSEIMEGERYLERLLGHPVVERYHPAILLVSSHRARLEAMMKSRLVERSGLVFRAANLRVSDSPAIWREAFSFGRELGQIGVAEHSQLDALARGVDDVEERLASRDLTATSVTADLTDVHYRDVIEPLLEGPPVRPPPPKPRR